MFIVRIEDIFFSQSVFFVSKVYLNSETYIIFELMSFNFAFFYNKFA